MLQLESKNLKIIFLLVLLITVVAPFIYAFKYVSLSEDDYGRAIWLWEDISYNLSHWYLTHNGRIVNAILSGFPVYDFPWLQIVLVLNFLVTPLVLFKVIHRILNYIGIYIEFIEKIIIAAILFILQISALPLIFEYYYWYAGATAYSFSYLSFLLCVFYVFGILKNKRFSVIGAVFFGVLCAGNNEILILFLNYLALILVVISFLYRKDILKKVVFLKLSILIISGVVVFSPGSLNRQSNYDDGGDIIGAFAQSLTSSVSLLLNEFKTLSSILGLATLFLMSIYLVKKNVDLNKLKYTHPVVLSLISIGALFLLIYVPTYATGGLNYNKGRVANMIQIVLLIVMFINLINMVSYLTIKKQSIFRFVQKKSFLLMLLFSLLTVYTSENFKNLIADYSMNNFEKLSANRNERVKLMIESNLNNIKVPTYRGSLTFPFEDMSSNPNHWYNKDYVNYINQKYQLQIDNVSVDFN